MTRHPSHYRRGAALIPATVVFLVAVVVALAAPWSASPAAGQAYEWTLESIPSRANLKAVWGASPTAVFAVGDSGTVLRFDGTQWAKMPWTLGNVSLMDVWGASATDVYAVGGYTLYRYDGTAWSEFPSQPFVPGYPALSVWGLSPNHIIVGSYGTPSGELGPMRLWNGSTWTTLGAYPGWGTMVDIWGTGPGNTFAVDAGGRVFTDYICGPGQTTWVPVHYGASGMRAVWGPGTGGAYLAGYEGVEHWNGVRGEPPGCAQNWLDEGAYTTLTGIWGLSASNIYAVGSRPGYSINHWIQHFDGTNWTHSPAPEGPGGPTGPTRLQGIWGDPSGDFWAVGDRGVVLRNIHSTPDTQLVVNSTAALCDAAPGDGKCDTGRRTPNGQVECTLCAAIQEANAAPDHDPIRFDIRTSDPGYQPASGTFVIASGLPQITAPVTLDAATQPGYAGRPLIEIDGTGHATGFWVRGGSSTIRGFVIRDHAGPGIGIDTPGGNTVIGCHIGTDAAGTSNAGNARGVVIDNSPGNTIGGQGPNDGNVISGNSQSGIEISGAASIGNRIVGNRIGMDATGTVAIANTRDGVFVRDGAAGTVIGGAGNGERNLISGNGDRGVSLLAALDTRIIANYIGVDATGRVAAPNRRGGVVATGASTNTTIGGTGPQDGNVISANQGDAVAFFGPGIDGVAVHRNKIGLDPTAADTLPNTGTGVRIEHATRVQIGDGAEGSGNVIAANGGIGIDVRGATTRTVMIEDNRIGYLASPPDTWAANQGGAIRIDGGVEDVTIGGTDGADWNRTFGPVEVIGGTTRRVRFLGNHAAILRSLLDAPDDRVPFDLDADGPSCNCWGREDGMPNDGVSTPRITKLSTSQVEGMSAAYSTVFIYRVLGVGRHRSRYFAHTVEALASGTAGPDSKFAVPVTLAPRDQVVAISTDTDGNSSEMSQLKRPVIFTHGIGGAWLVANDGTEIWLPNGLTAPTQNANLRRMGFNPDGTSKEPIVAREMLESTLGLRVVYGPIMDWLASHGYAGEATNQGGPDMDAWRYWYDWRQSPIESATGLRALVERVTSGDDDVARSCEVDIVAHSYGGVVSNVYIRDNPDHARCRVHRYVTMGIPVMGAPLAAGAHTRGYIFGLEKELIYGYPIFAGGLKVNWGQMIGMARNLPAAYTLLPSEKYWAASQGNQPSGYMVDLNGRPLTSHQATSQFMGAPKIDAQGNPLGLDRNIAMWNRELERVHQLTNDWSDFSGPPQVFRIVGKIANSAIQGWTLLGDPPSRFRYNFVTDLQRWEPGDTYEHWSYRLRSAPVLGNGDGTVSIASATLGRFTAAGTDFSGVGSSPWIEEFKYFPCLHNDMLLEKCTEGGLKSLQYVTDVLLAGYEVPPSATEAQVAAAVAATALGTTPGLSEVVYVTGSSPFTVRVQDDAGLFNGPPDPAEPEQVEYQMPEVVYWASPQTACISFAQGKAYTLTITALADPATVQVIRILSDGESSHRNLFFPRTEIAAGGVLRMSFPAGGAPESAPLALDAAGDGIFESTVDPAASATSSSTAPAIPLPQPFRLNLVGYRSDAGPRTSAVRFPDVGGPTWGWSASTPSAWLSASALSGTTPDSLVLAFDATSMATGAYMDSLSLTLNLGGLAVPTKVEILLSVFEAPSIAQIALSPEYVKLRPGEMHAFTAQGFDETGGPMPVTPTWSAEGGAIDAYGTFTAGAFNGLYFVKAHSGSVEAEAVVEIVGGAELTTAPAAFGLHQNFPNPFSDGTVIAFDTQAPSRVRLTLYDVRGRLLSTLVDADYPAGRHTHALDTAGLSNGVYFYRVEMGSFTQTRKMAYVQ